MNKQYGFIFDLDGTLIDSLEDLANAMNHVLADLGVQQHPLDAYKSFIGDGAEMLVRRALPETYREPKKIQSLVKEMQRYYSQDWHTLSKPYSGIIDLLKTLSAKEYILAVLSNKPDRFVKQLVDHFFSDFSFNPVLGARPGYPKKPNPQVALSIAKEHNIPFENWIFVGDTGIDMQTAKEAGMTGIGALWGFRSKEELLEHGAKSTIAHPRELLEFI